MTHETPDASVPTKLSYGGRGIRGIDREARFELSPVKWAQGDLRAFFSLSYPQLLEIFAFAAKLYVDRYDRSSPPSNQFIIFDHPSRGQARQPAQAFISECANALRKKLQSEGHTLVHPEDASEPIVQAGFEALVLKGLGDLKRRDPVKVETIMARFNILPAGTADDSADTDEEDIQEADRRPNALAVAGKAPAELSADSPASTRTAQYSVPLLRRRQLARTPYDYRTRSSASAVTSSAAVGTRRPVSELSLRSANGIQRAASSTTPSREEPELGTRMPNNIGPYRVVKRPAAAQREFPARAQTEDASMAPSNSAQSTTSTARITIGTLVRTIQHADSVFSPTYVQGLVAALGGDEIEVHGREVETLLRALEYSADNEGESRRQN